MSAGNNPIFATVKCAVCGHDFRRYDEDEDEDATVCEVCFYRVGEEQQKAIERQCGANRGDNSVA